MRITIVGTGSFGTALANRLSFNEENEIFLLGRNKELVDSINTKNINPVYFPYIKLRSNINATVEKSILLNSDLIFLALPSGVLIDFIENNKKFINEKSFIVNLAKGFGKKNKTIAENLMEIFPSNEIATMKGPTFADELIREFPSSFTFGSKNRENYLLIKKILKNTRIYLDFSTDYIGVELASILKNIYAIIIGIIDANANSANMRFFILTKAFNEARKLMQYLGAKEETLYKYCGIGDFGLTALNDLSRNRTLGLMIGKGFLKNPKEKNSVVLEGLKALNILTKKLEKFKGEITMIYALDSLINQRIDLKTFINYVINY